MSIAEIERFAADLKSNEALRAEADSLQPDTAQGTPMATLVSFAASKGYGFTAEELLAFAKLRAGAKGKILSDAELNGIAGGDGGSNPDLGFGSGSGAAGTTSAGALTQLISL